jgi:predicted nucleotidyltransferase
VPDVSVIKGVPLTPVEVRFLRELAERDVRFMIVGMSAADLQGAHIGTQDIDLWFRRTSDPGLESSARSVGCLFMWRSDPPMLEGEELERFDVVNRLDGLDDFETEYAGAVDSEIEGIPVKLLPLHRIIVSKKAADRPKDRVALPALKAALQANKMISSRQRNR